MATRKKLADLVREEVNKQSKDETASSQASPPKTAKRPSAAKKSTTAKSTTSRRSSAKTSTAPAGDVAALEKKVTGLEQHNRALISENQTLLSKVTELEVQIEAFDQVENKLKAAESKQESMQRTLDEAKQDALKLAQENQKLLEQIKGLKTRTQSAVTKTAVTKTAAVTRRPVIRKSAPPGRVPANRGIQRSPQTNPIVYKPPAKKPFTRPIAPPRMPSQRVIQNPDEFETWCYD